MSWSLTWVEQWSGCQEAKAPQKRSRRSDNRDGTPSAYDADAEMPQASDLDKAHMALLRIAETDSAP